MGVILVSTLYWIRFAIASWLSITNYDYILYSSLINANTIFPIWYVLRPEITIHSYPSTQQITNLIKYGVATGVTTTYNTANSPNKLLSQQFICNVPYNKTTETFPVFQQFYCTHNCPLFCMQIIQIYILFQSQYLFLHVFLPYFIIKIAYYLCIISNTNSNV